MGREIEEVLDAYLGRVINGESAEDCLTDSRGESRELESLLKVGVELVRESRAVEADPEFRARLHSLLLGRLSARREKAARRAGIAIWHTRWAVAACAVVCLSVATGAAVAASAGALPDQPLYAVKLAVEDARVSLTFSPDNDAELHIEFAERRAAEIAEMARQGKAEEIPELAERATAHLTRVHASEVAASVPRGEQAEAFKTQAPGTFASAPPPVPDTVDEAGEEPELTEDPAGGAGASGEPESEESAKLKSVVEASRARSLQVMETALAEAPQDSASSLREAIRRLRAGYDDVLGELESESGQ